MSALVASPTAVDKVQVLQRTLYRAAKAGPGRRLHALYEKVHRRDVLERAWEQVRRNRGAPGLHRTTIADVESYGSPVCSISWLRTSGSRRIGRWRPAGCSYPSPARLSGARCRFPREAGVCVAGPGVRLLSNGDVDISPGLSSRTRRTPSATRVRGGRGRRDQLTIPVQPGCSGAFWREEQPLGIRRTFHLITAVTDIERARGLYEHVCCRGRRSTSNSERE